MVKILFSPVCAASSVSLLCLSLLPSGSTASPCSLSGSSRDSSRSWSPACLSSSVCRRETIPPALSPPLGISRQHRASRATDTTTVWLFISAALPTAESFGLEFVTSLSLSAVQCWIQRRLSTRGFNFRPFLPCNVIHTFLLQQGNFWSSSQPQCQAHSDRARQRWSGRGVGIGREGREVG